MKIALMGAGSRIAAAVIAVASMAGISTVERVAANQNQTSVRTAENAPTNKPATPVSQQNMVITDNRILPGRPYDKEYKSSRYGRQPRQKMQKHTNRQRCKHNAKLKRRKK